MRKIMLFGQHLTVPQAKEYLTGLKQAYELHKEKEQFFFQEQPLQTKFAKYLIEYLEVAIKRCLRG